MKANVLLIGAAMGAALACAAAVAQGESLPCADFAGSAIPIRRLNGMNNTVPVRLNGFAEFDQRVCGYFAALEIPETRFHDPVIGENSGIDLVDVSRIFPLFHLDESDPKNYNFAPTDEYIAYARQYGGEIEFRFGEQIEGGKTPRRICPPPDIGKWARICLNIARHYNDGWAEGFRWNIRRFSVWEEPDNDRLLAGATKGNFEKCYLPMYAAVARLVKAQWPEAQVGGPNTMGVCPKLEIFLDYCKTNSLPLDFCAVTLYHRDPAQMRAVVRKLRAALDRRGFASTETEISEWHLWSAYSFLDLHTFDNYVADLTGVGSAAFTTATLALLQDEPIDHMFFYAANVNYFGIFDLLCCRPRSPYYALRDFAEAVHGAVRVPCPVQPAPGWYALATRRDDGGVRLLLTAYHAKDALRLKVKGAALKSATVVVEKGEPAPFTGFAFADGELRVPKPAGDAVYLFRD